MGLWARRMPVLAATVVVALGLVLVLAGVAGAEGTVVTGAAGSGALTIAPSAGPVVSSNVELVSSTRVFFVESMPKAMSVRRVTIGDLARAPGCTESPQVELSVYSFGSGSDLRTGTLVAQSSFSQPFGSELGRVTWLLDPTALEAAGSYAFVVKRVSGSCGSAQERSWAHNAERVDGGERACADLQDGSGRLRLWHVQESEDARACRAFRGVTNFAAGMATGWAETALTGEEATINTTRGRCATDLEAAESEWSGGIVCQLPTYTTPGETTRDGWYYGLPWNGSGLEGRPRDLYLSLEPDLAPVVSTSAASDVHGTSARLNGSIDPGSSPTRYRFEWGTETGYGNVLPEPDAEAGEGSGEAPVSQTLRGLEPGTTYHYRLVAAHGTGRAVDGADRTFRTATAPVETSPPAITGSVVHFQSSTASTGGWSGTHPMSFSYQWRRCDEAGARCADVEDATDQTYQVGSADFGSTLRVVVTATNAAGEASATSAASSVATDIPPSNDTAPRIYGEPVEGERLTADAGSWSGARTITYGYQWRSCDSRGASCSDIEGATEADYTVQSGDVGSTLRVLVRATNSAGSSSVSSEASAVVSAANLLNTSTPTISEETTSSGDTLVADPGRWTGSGPIAYFYRWQRCDGEGANCTNIPFATGSTYVLDAPDVGTRLRVLVTAGNREGSTSIASAATETIANAAPSDVAAPTITGSAAVGGFLSAQEALWSGVRPIDFTYQWQRCDSRGRECADIEDAVDPFYEPGSADAGNTVRIVVAARSAAGEASATSPVTPVLLSEPVLANSRAPAISGTLFVGETLSADEGLWAGTGSIAYSYQWQRCTAHRTDCVDIEGATSASYRLAASDLGRTLAIVVTAGDDHETAEAITISGQVRAEGSPVETEAPVVSGAATVGQELSVSDGSWSGSGPITYAYQWQACDDATHCEDIPGSTRASYALSEGELDQSVRAVVTATNSSGSTATVSALTATVTPPTPYNTEAPTITGTVRAGLEVSVETGRWTGTGTIRYADRWQRCDTRGERCADIEGATATRYTPTAEDVARTLRVVITATDETALGRATSEQTVQVVAAGAPANTVAPAISGRAEAGTTLTANEGTWTGSGPIEYAYQWQQCNPDGSDCEDIEAATRSTYRPTSDDVDSILQVVVTATNGSGADHASSAQTAAVTGTEPAPRVLQNSSPPSISGEAREGQTQTADHGEWTEHDTITYAYQWRDCDTAGQHCSDIERATASTYVLQESDVGHTVRVLVSAASTSGSQLMSSDPTAEVTVDAPANSTLPAISGETIDGQTLTADEGSWSGRPGTLSYAWQRCNSEGRSCATIEGSPADAAYPLGPDDVGHTVRVLVRATNTAGSTEAGSNPTSIILASTPANTSLPIISGTAVQGVRLTATPGSWSGTPTLSYAYQWRRCNEAGEGCADIEGATSSSYRLEAADLESTLRVVVSASNTAGRTSATSTATAPVGAPEPPVNLAPPQVFGSANPGVVLSANEGWWTGLSPIEYTQQWQRCDSEGARCVAIEGAAEWSYTVTSEDTGLTLRLSITAMNASGTETAASEPTAVVTDAAPVNVVAPSIPRPHWQGAEARAAPGYWSGSVPITYSYQWQRCNAEGESCADIEGATEQHYTFVEADVSGTVRVTVSATNTLGTSSPTVSDPTDVIAAEALENTAAPRISGTPSLDWFGILTASTGSWSSGVDFYDYQWQRCDSEGRSCTNIPGAAGSSYQPVTADIARRLVVSVTAHVGDSYTRTATSPASAAVLPHTVGAPVADVVPSFSGRVENGHALTADTGIWGGYQPISFYLYRWQRCSSPTSCRDIEGASYQSYQLETADVGQRVRVLVIAFNRSGYGSWTESAVSEIVADPAPSNLTAPSLSGEAVIGAELEVENGTWAGAVPWWSYHWKRCDSRGESCADIEGAFGASYRLTHADLGATVRAVVHAENPHGSADANTAPSSVVRASTRPANTTAPSISGGTELGYYAYAENGVWSGSPDIAYEYQWQRCDETGESCSDIADATQTDHRIARADIGSTLRVLVTATNGAGSVSQASDPTAVVSDPGAISNISPPQLQYWWGPYFGEFFEAYEQGQWAGSPDLADQWQRCDPLTADPETGVMRCIDIEGATNAGEYIPTAADVGFKLRLQETATNATERVVIDSAPSAEPVGQFSNDEGDTYTGATVAGETITAHTSVTTNSGLPTSTRYTFLRVNEEAEPTLLQEGEEAGYRLTSEDLGYQIRIETITSIWREDHETVVARREDSVTTTTVEPAPSDETLPAIEGTTTAGQTLTATTGEWRGGGGTLTYDYQWQRCDTRGESCTNIEGATGPTYTLTSTDAGSTLRVQVTARNGAARGTATSGATSVVASARAPVEAAAPTISGEVAELHTLTATSGRWEGEAPITYAYQWQTCKSDGSECSDLDGATQQTYRVPAATAGATLRVQVTATDAGGEATASSTSTAQIEGAPAPVETAVPQLTLLGPAEVGSTLMTEGGSWTNIDHSELGYVWRRCDTSGERCADIAGAASNAYDLTSADVGSRIQVEVLTSNEAGDTTATTELTAPVVASTGSAAGMLVYTAFEAIGTAQQDGSESQTVASCSTTGMVEGDCDYHHPRISPNGKMILTSKQPIYEEGPEQLALMYRDGSHERTIPTATPASEPVWTPDGTAILYTSQDGEGRTSLERVSADGSDAEAPTTIPTAGTDPRSAVYSTDGEHLVYTAADTEGHRGLYVAGPDGEQPRQLDLGTITDAYNPALSPGGQQITFAAPTTTPDLPSEIHDLHAINIDGSDLHKITQDGQSYDSAAPASSQTIITIHETVTITNFGFGITIEITDPVVWAMNTNGAGGHTLTSITTLDPKDVSVGPTGGPTAHAALGLPADLTFHELRYCLERVALCNTWHGDRNKATRLSQAYFTGEVHSDSTIANAFRHSLWVALMAHSAFVEGESVLSAFKMAELHEIGDDGNPFWRSREYKTRRASLMDMHNDFVGENLLLDDSVQTHNEHYICTRILHRIRGGRKLREAQVDHDNRYVGPERPYWFKTTDPHHRPVVLISADFPDKECG